MHIQSNVNRQGNEFLKRTHLKTEKEDKWKKSEMQPNLIEKQIISTKKKSKTN